MEVLLDNDDDEGGELVEGTLRRCRVVLHEPVWRAQTWLAEAVGPLLRSLSSSSRTPPPATTASSSSGLPPPSLPIVCDARFVWPAAASAVPARRRACSSRPASSSARAASSSYVQSYWLCPTTHTLHIDLLVLVQLPATTATATTAATTTTAGGDDGTDDGTDECQLCITLRPALVNHLAGLLDAFDPLVAATTTQRVAAKTATRTPGGLLSPGAAFAAAASYGDDVDDDRDDDDDDANDEEEAASHAPAAAAELLRAFVAQSRHLSVRARDLTATRACRVKTRPLVVEPASPPPPPSSFSSSSSSSSSPGPVLLAPASAAASSLSSSSPVRPPNMADGVPHSEAYYYVVRNGLAQQSITIVACTAQVGIDAERKLCLASGMDALLSKPFSKKELLAVLDVEEPAAGPDAKDANNKKAAKDTNKQQPKEDNNADSAAAQRRRQLASASMSASI